MKEAQGHTSMVRVVAYVDGAIVGEETCTVPAHLAEEIAMHALIQAQDPDLDLAWENWNNAKEREEEQARKGPSPNTKLHCIAERLTSEGYRATLEYPGFLCVQLANGATLNMGFVNGPFGWDVQDAEFRTITDLGGESELTEASSEDELYAYALATCGEVRAEKKSA